MTKGDGSPGNTDGYRYLVRIDGELVAAGWTLGTKGDAKREAWLALEAQGLVDDGAVA